MIIRKYFNLENFVSFALMFEKFSLNKQKMVKRAGVLGQNLRAQSGECVM